MNKPLTVGSLFAGIGGVDAGFERAGITTRWQVEIDPSCRDILARHFPDAERYADAREVSGADLEPVDVITFGSPCQDLSVAGQRRGMAGERSGLYFEAIRIIQEMRNATGGRCPTFTVWENVEGALSSHRGRDFGAALDALAERGALDIAWSVLDSQYFGVAQRRRRVFVVADFGGERSGEILALTESLCGNPAPGRTAGLAHAAIAFQPTQDATAHDDCSPTVTNSHGGSPAIAFTERTRAEGRTFESQDELAYALTNPGSGGQPHSARIAAGVTVRRLTPVECERLQGFPDQWTRVGASGKAMSDSARYRMLGNAVTVNVAAWIGQRIVMALSAIEGAVA